MSQERPPEGILDTCTLIFLPRIRSADQLPAIPLITTVTLAELSVGPLLADTDIERASRQIHLQQAEANFIPLPFDSDAARNFARVAASLHRSGRKTKARTYDAMIAAIALSRDFPVYTCNPDDFRSIEGLMVVEVDHPDHARSE